MATADDLQDAPLRIGISRCLLGDKVRFDGGHKRDPFLVDMLGPYVSFVPVCPEVEVGMPTPRPALRLVQTADAAVHLRVIGTGEDWTTRMNRWATRRARSLDEDDLDGYVWKRASPSCGLERVKLYPERSDGRVDAPAKTGRGLFAAAVVERFPHLPVEEEGRLTDPPIRENFIERLFAYRRLKRLWRDGFTLGKLVAFHTAHKLTLLAHEPEGYRALGRLVAQASALPRAELRDRYISRFMSAMTLRASRGRHANVLSHMAGYLKRQLDDDDRRELTALIEDYRRGLTPLVVPLTLLSHHVRRHQIDYLLGQTYLQPHPRELMLRNHV